MTESSTTPSELPRWPPVFATVSMMVVRISEHSWTSSRWSSRLRSCGPFSDESRVMWPRILDGTPNVPHRRAAKARADSGLQAERRFDRLVAALAYGEVGQHEGGRT